MALSGLRGSTKGWAWNADPSIGPAGSEGCWVKKIKSETVHFFPLVGPYGEAIIETVTDGQVRIYPNLPSLGAADLRGADLQHVAVMADLPHGDVQVEEIAFHRAYGDDIEEEVPPGRNDLLWMSCLDRIVRSRALGY